MKRITCASLIGLCISTSSHSADTLNLDEVVVTAARVPQSADNVLADVSVIDREEIERAGQSTLIELLQRQAGVEISSNGGAGKSADLFLRGTNSNHVVVLVDGLRVNSATTGQTAYQHLPLSQIERIEIVRGPTSSLYGADAVGGVVQIFTKRGTSNDIKFNAFAGYGSYHTKTGEAGVNGGVGDTRFGLTLSSYDTEGFSARRVISTTQPIDKDDDGYRNLSVSAYAEHTIQPGHSLGIQFFQSKSHNNYDGGNNYANYSNQTLQSYAVTSKNQWTDFWLSTLKIGKGIDDSDDQSKPAVTNPTGKGTFRTEQKQLSWQNDFTLPVGLLTLAYDRRAQEVDSATRPAARYTRSQDNNGWVASYLANIDAHSIHASLRRDDNSQFGSHTTGGLSYGYHITPLWQISASAGTAFKAPTFNELYWPAGVTAGFSGNPDLDPETSRNREIALRYMGASLRSGIVVFKNEIENLIVNGDPVKNISEAEIRGVTLEGNWKMTSAWELGGNFTVQSPKTVDSPTTAEIDKLLVRRSNRHATMYLNWQSGPWQVQAEATGSSFRFNNSTNTKRIDGYTIFNLSSSYALNSNWKIEARANNIFDKEYVLAYTGNSATAAPYETAGANVFVGLRWQPQ
jgi:vitamin B12 transporter